MAYEVEKKWVSLYRLAISRSLMLETTKAKFAKLTIQEIDEFYKKIEEFVKHFQEEGPGAIGQDLDRGLKLMDVSYNKVALFSMKQILVA